MKFRNNSGDFNRRMNDKDFALKSEMLKQVTILVT
jgi:hypothetical protein